jgi:hypothetical protein
MEQYRPWLRRRTPPPAPSHFDVWLSRAGAIATVVLAAAGVFGLFYTVIPLYKLAALDEQVSKRELELNRVQKQLDATHARVRHDLLHEFVFDRGAECTGLMEPPQYEEAVKAIVDPKGPEAAAVRAAKPGWLRILSANTSECFGARVDGLINQFRPEDKVIVLEHLRSIIADVEADRVVSLARAKALPVEVHRNPGTLPEESASEKFLEMQLRWLKTPAEERERVLRDRRIEDAQEAIAMAWGKRSRERIDGLNRIVFPGSQ